MKDDRQPKVFISYSWSSDSLVLELAQRLLSQGVDVVLDKWDLKEGQDKYAFMEQCVNNPEITKVLIICDKAYSQKANNRTGGVGDETVIISSEIYGNMTQEKFIPVIAEKNENGNPYVPTYIKTRIYVDLSDEETFEIEYEKLLRNIYEKPLYRKPTLGKRPEWLDEEKTDLFPIKDLIRQIKGSSNEKKRRNCISRFQMEYIEVLKKYMEKGASPERIYENFINTKPVRDIFLEYVETISEIENNYAEILAESFEMMYNQLACGGAFESELNISSYDLDLFKIHCWELFICVIAYMRHLTDYKSINVMLTYTYFLKSNAYISEMKPHNYTAFRHYSKVIEEGYKPKTDKDNLFTLLGDAICHQRQKIPIYTSEAIAEADLFLYQVLNAFDFSENTQENNETYWFPRLYIYVNTQPIEWIKMKSLRFCEKIKILFGVDNIQELKDAVGKCISDDKMKYRGSWDYALSILDCIKIEEIGTLK